MPSLQERRNEIDMVQTYKIVMGVDMVNSELWFERADNRRLSRNNVVRHNLVPKKANHEFRRQFFSSRVVDKWNSLPTDVREAKTVSHFKRLYTVQAPHTGSGGTRDRRINPRTRRTCHTARTSSSGS